MRCLKKCFFPLSDPGYLGSIFFGGISNEDKGFETGGKVKVFW